MVKTNFNDKLLLKRENLTNPEDFFKERGLIQSYGATLNKNKETRGGIGNGNTYVEFIDGVEEQSLDITFTPRSLSFFELIGDIATDTITPSQPLPLIDTDVQLTSDRYVSIEGGKITSLKVTADRENPVSVDISITAKTNTPKTGLAQQENPVTTTGGVLVWKDTELRVDGSVVGSVTSFSFTIEFNVETEVTLGESNPGLLVEGLRDVDFDIDVLADTDFLDAQQNNSEVDIELVNKNTGGSISLGTCVFDETDNSGDFEDDGARTITTSGISLGNIQINL